MSADSKDRVSITRSVTVGGAPCIYLVVDESPIRLDADANAYHALATVRRALANPPDRAEATAAARKDALREALAILERCSSLEGARGVLRSAVRKAST
jgi:hypothetical protein